MENETNASLAQLVSASAVNSSTYTKLTLVDFVQRILVTSCCSRAAVGGVSSLKILVSSCSFKASINGIAILLR